MSRFRSLEELNVEWEMIQSIWQDQASKRFEAEGFNCIIECYEILDAEIAAFKAILDSNPDNS